MALGIIGRCLDLCVGYANDRVQVGYPIGEFQLIQEKLARMEVAGVNVQNLVFRCIEAGPPRTSRSTSPRPPPLKLVRRRDRATEVALDAVQVERQWRQRWPSFPEQLARDARRCRPAPDGRTADHAHPRGLLRPS